MAEITDGMKTAAKAAATPQISEGIGAVLRKFCDSEAAAKARLYLHAMPDNDWSALVDMLAEAASHAALDAVAPMIEAAAYERGQADMRGKAVKVAEEHPVTVWNGHVTEVTAYGMAKRDIADAIRALPTGG